MLFKHRRYLMQHEKPLSYGKLQNVSVPWSQKWMIFLTQTSKVKCNYIPHRLLSICWPGTMVSVISCADRLGILFQPASQLSAVAALETQLWKISGASAMVKPRGCNCEYLSGTQNNYLMQVREQVPGTLGVSWTGYAIRSLRSNESVYR